MVEYEYGVHCGDSDCYACGTQRYNCDELNYCEHMCEEDCYCDSGAECND